jgi:two-component system response regulator NreC
MSTEGTAGSGAAPHTRRIRIVLADDHRVVRRGLQLILDGESDFEVVAQAGDIDAVRRHARELAPDVLVLDLNMPGGSVLDAIPDLVTELAETRIVVLTMRDEPAFARAVMPAGARGYVLKEAADSELAEAIRKVAAGGRYLNQRFAGRLFADEIREGGWD